MRKMSDSEINEALIFLEGWQVVSSKLVKDFVFSSFVSAWGFMAQVALEAQAMEHHPEWSNSYSKVRIELFTHEAGGITYLDIVLAKKIEQILQGTVIA